MTHRGGRTREIGMFRVNLKILEFLPEGSGTGFLHKKRVPEMFLLPSLPATHSGKNFYMASGSIKGRCTCCNSGSQLEFR
jgi:hypothetical protein